MNPTLPLFDGPEFAAVHPAPRAEPLAAPPADDGRPAESHLRAARRLAREIRRLPERSPAQTRLGLAICAHLQALLADSAGGR